MTSHLTDQPHWCLTEGTWDTLTDGSQVATWERSFGANVWVACEDVVVNGHRMRGQWVGCELPDDRLSVDQARALARDLLAAADALS
ncbi:MAG: hypothetical protein JWR32_2991 [Mycobacterium sp.]|nr:hypothetical protein [Mycobacterium sp.]